jgi:hypothetical protein
VPVEVEGTRELRAHLTLDLPLVASALAAPLTVDGKETAWSPRFAVIRAAQASSSFGRAELVSRSQLVVGVVTLAQLLGIPLNAPLTLRPRNP